MTVTKFVLINEIDNILVCCHVVQAGENIVHGSDCFKVATHIDVGHKIARYKLVKGQKVIKHGVSIGSATVDISIGEHVHLHNMKSDYIPSHTRQSLVES
jgi:hypothetical protein